MSNARDVYLWTCAEPLAVEAPLLARYRELLAPAEKERMDRFVFDRHRTEFLVSRALVRTVLGHCLERPPASLVFDHGPYGRPELAGDAVLRFNATNTQGLVACAVTRGPEIGIDAEPLSRGPEVQTVSASVFTQEERREMDRLGPRRAVELWTLKESYMKARGLGFSLSPLSFTFAFDDDGRAPRLATCPADDTAERWSFTIEEIAGHLVAICAERPRGELRHFPVVPLASSM